MPKKNAKTLALCIYANSASTLNEEYLKKAKTISSNVFLFASVLDNKELALIKQLNISFIHVNNPDEIEKAITSLNFDWFFCLKSNELIEANSSFKIDQLLNDSKNQIYGVYVSDNSIKNQFIDFTFIRNLGQFDNINDEGSLLVIEPRIVQKESLGTVLKGFLDNSEVVLPFSKIAHGLKLTPNGLEHKESITEEENHDLLCLKEEKWYGSTAEDNIDELNVSYIGFRVINMGYLDGYFEIANRGWGTDIMYTPMLNFLCNNGNYDEAKKIFDDWIKNHSGNKTFNLYASGGSIYANLFLFNEAISLYEKALKIAPNPAFFESLGKINIILGNKEKAIEYLKASLMLRPYPLTEEILSTISNKKWRQLTLTACIIARDEENSIAKTIASLENIADEIIVVDTGSVDNTISVAHTLGCKIIPIQWDDDFSAARNIAIKEATCDYILMIDADEFIDVKDRIGLLFAKQLLSPDLDKAYRIQFKDEDSSQNLSISLMNSFLNRQYFENQVRLFPRRPELKYSGFVFESLDKSLEEAKISISPSPFFPITRQIVNTDFRDTRKITAVKKTFAFADDPTVALEGMLFFLKLGELEEGFKWFEKTKNLNPALIANIVSLYATRKQNDLAKKIAFKGLQDCPDSIEISLALVNIYFHEELFSPIYNILLPFIQDDQIEMPQESKSDAFYYFGVCALEKNALAEGIDFIARALEINKLSTKYQIAGLYGFAKFDDWENFLAAAAKIVRQEEIEIGFEIKDFSDLGRLVFMLVGHFIRADKEEESIVLRKIIAHMVFAKFINKDEINNMASLINEQGQPLTNILRNK